VALLLLKAEILYLDCLETESLEIFRLDIEPKLNMVPQEIRFIIRQNKSEIAITLVDADSFRQADLLYDQRQLTGTKFWDPESMVYAYEAAASNRHYEALPALWRELGKSYEQGGWRYYRQASRRVAKEFLQIGWAHAAEYHAIVGQDTELIGVIADHLLAWRQQQHVEGMIQRLLANANLKRHAAIACELLARLADAIPDNQVDPVVHWLLRRCSIVPTGWIELSLATSAWEAVQALTPRLNTEQAKEVVQIATQHQSLGSTDRLRKHITQTIDACVNTLPLDDLPELARIVLPLATSQRNDADYDDVLHLLRHIAFRGDNNIKNQIGNVLYPGTAAHVELLRIAPEFDRHLENEQEAALLANYWAQDVRKQIQPLTHGEEFARPDISYGSITVQDEDGRFGISIYSSIGLKAVIAHRSLLPLESIQLLIEAILEMIRAPKNVLGNKVDLINCIIELADSITPEQAETVYATLAPLATGEVVGLDVTQIVGDPNHPLNSQKVRLGDPSKVQGGALFALACIEAHQPSVYGVRLSQLLEQAMANPNSEIRNLAFTAAGRAAVLPEPLLIRVLMGTRDNDPIVAEAAFLAVNGHVRNTEDFWNILLYSLTVACVSPHVNVRRAVAFTINNVRSQCPIEDIANKIQALEVALAVDMCHSVRSQISLAVA
jgi:hypothetical protein